MKPATYFLNLAYTIAFLYSLMRVADGHGYIWLGILVISTTVLTTIFFMECYTIKERE